MYRRITEAQSVGKLKPPRPKEYRIVVATDAAKELNDKDLRQVAKHLSHSSETSRKYYEFSNTIDVIFAHQTLSFLTKEMV